jgi:glycosyltransferase involved in cell wall biosynthesis
VKVLVVSGIWPPDVGGPASHAPELAAFLAGRGHEVEVVTTASARPEPEPYPVRWVTRRLPVGVRHVGGAGLVAASARRADVVYTTGLFVRTALGASLVSAPFVVKLTADPAFERARARGLYRGGLEGFQERGGGHAAELLRRARDRALRRAAHVVCPSAYLRELALAWGLDPGRVTVLPNPAPRVDGLPRRKEARLALGLDAPTLAFAGRLTPQKSLDVLFQALAELPDVDLLLAGEGPEEGPLRRRAAELGLAERVRFLGPQPRRRVLELYRAADAAVLSSSWENLPHAVLEALAAGTPVVATRSGGVAEIVSDGHNGLLVEPDDPAALAAATRRLLADPELAARLRAAAAPSVAEYSPDAIYTQLEALLAEASR